jgi:hypothetical protein
MNFLETTVMYLNNLRFFSATSNKHPTLLKNPQGAIPVQIQTKVEEPGFGRSELNWNQNWN